MSNGICFFTSSPRPLQGLQLHLRYMREENQNRLCFTKGKKVNTTLNKKKKKRKKESGEERQAETENIEMEQEFGK